VYSPTFKRVELEVSGLSEEGGVLEITTTNDAQVRIYGDCPELVCPVDPGTTLLTFAVRSKRADNDSVVYFTVTPTGDVVDPDPLNNTVEVEVAP